MTPQSSCKYNGHGFNDDGVCIYCHEDDGTQTTASDEMTQPNQSELDMNMIEKIIADHNKAMRTDMASEIVGGTRSKAITDVITVKAITAHTNAEIARTLDRLTAGISADIPNYYDQDGWEVAMNHIQAERAKLKELK